MSLFARGSEDGSVLLGNAEFILFVPLASFAQWFRSDVARESYGARQEIAFDQVIDETEFQCLLSGNRIAFRAHLDGLGDAHQPRQPLGATCARNNA